MSGALELALAVLAALLLGFVLGRMSAPDPETPALPPAPPSPPPPPPPLPDRIHIESLNDAALLTRGPLVEAANAAARAGSRSAIARNFTAGCLAASRARNVPILPAPMTATPSSLRSTCDSRSLD